MLRFANGGEIASRRRRAHTEAVVLSPELRSDLEWVSDDFDRLVSNAVGPALDAPTRGTKWTNRELLFHLWFGQRLTRVFIPLIGGFSRLPPGASRAWARLLTAATRPLRVDQLRCERRRRPHRAAPHHPEMDAPRH